MKNRVAKTNHCKKKRSPQVTVLLKFVHMYAFAFESFAFEWEVAIDVQ